MTDTPWMTRNWFVSPWNYLPEVTKELNFAKQIKIHDITLRDGEQQAGIEFTKDDKIRIAEALAEAGVHRIEAGMPAVSPADAEAIKEIVKRNLGPEIFAFARCMKEDVKRAVDTGVKGIVTEIPSSEHIIKYAYRWSLEKAIDLSIEATQYAKEQGLYVVFFPIDSSRAEMSWYLNLIERVAKEGHMDALALVDTFGVLGPHAVRYMVREAKKRVNKPLETHFHSDFGMGVANTILALSEGAEVVHSTVLGIGERAGNAPMEEIVMALRTMYNIDLGIDYSKLYPLAKLVEKLSGQKVPTNKPIVGDLLFSVESGIIASWVKNCGDEHLTEVFPFRPEFVGQQEPKVVLGKNSGLDSIRIWLNDLGREATEEQMTEILMQLKSESMQKKRLLTVDEFLNIVDRVLA
ncbi:MAG: pyruvate carboxyltransferase [Anaerolineae bacterium]|nr:pyruvate carboxyltransferase [Anaerolineae bacterium]